MIQKTFASNAADVLKNDSQVIGIAMAGSWLTNELDEFSDVDLIIVTREKISDQKQIMFEYAHRLGSLLNAFTGEHVGEPRVLICLYKDPLLHVDIKFLTIGEFKVRIETPSILFDRDDQLKEALDRSTEVFPLPDYQWIEDRFWTWVHYALLKTGRGELLEALDFLSFLRMVVLGPLLHLHNGNLPRGVRKVEAQLKPEDLNALKETIAVYDSHAILSSLSNTVSLYRKLRANLYDENIHRQMGSEKIVMIYFEEIKQRTSKA